MDIYVLSGLYLYTNNRFELDTLGIKVFTDVNKANDMVRKVVNREIPDDDKDWDREENIDDDGCLSLCRFDSETGDRIVCYITKVTIK